MAFSVPSPVAAPPSKTAPWAPALVVRSLPLPVIAAVIVMSSLAEDPLVWIATSPPSETVPVIVTAPAAVLVRLPLSVAPPVYDCSPLVITFASEIACDVTLSDDSGEPPTWPKNVVPPTPPCAIRSRGVPSESVSPLNEMSAPGVELSVVSTVMELPMSGDSTTLPSKFTGPLSVRTSSLSVIVPARSETDPRPVACSAGPPPFESSSIVWPRTRNGSRTVTESKLMACVPPSRPTVTRLKSVSRAARSVSERSSRPPVSAAPRKIARDGVEGWRTSPAVPVTESGPPVKSISSPVSVRLLALSESVLANSRVPVPTLTSTPLAWTSAGPPIVTLELPKSRLVEMTKGPVLSIVRLAPATLEASVRLIDPSSDWSV
ncbi:MAG: hypothetical protein GIKADHBN_03241 [Phycisphaerales bacterium]|nr:hypothetical protein [Phycisphaerales bacterium]